MGYAKLFGFRYGLDRLLRELALGMLIMPYYLEMNPQTGPTDYCNMIYYDINDVDYYECL